jgi:hypothetical protein
MPRLLAVQATGEVGVVPGDMVTTEAVKTEPDKLYGYLPCSVP